MSMVVGVLVVRGVVVGGGVVGRGQEVIVPLNFSAS